MGVLNDPEGDKTNKPKIPAPKRPRLITVRLTATQIPPVSTGPVESAERALVEETSGGSADYRLPCAGRHSE